jgi:hypothetical protein
MLSMNAYLPEVEEKKGEMPSENEERECEDGEMEE